MRLNSFDSFGDLNVGGNGYRIARLSQVETAGMPYTIRILLENLLRNEDGVRVTRDQIDAVLSWGSGTSFESAIDLSPSRVFLHDTNGVPALADIAAMRDAMASIGGSVESVNPLIPSELVIDHSVTADLFGSGAAFDRNSEIEYERNAERYRFLRWGQGTLHNFTVVPPGKGIMHQVNLEYLARVIMVEDQWAHPDICLGTDSHTTMVNGLGVLGWGIGGIEAEAAMLGESFNMLLPQVVGVRLVGSLPSGTTATDLVLTITERLRDHGVVGKFVEFHGDGVARLSLADRATIANMSPEFGSTCAYFPIDNETIRYLRFTGRPEWRVSLVEAYAKAQGLWHVPEFTASYSEEVELDLGQVRPSLAGPGRPQDRVPLEKAQPMFHQALAKTSPGSSPTAVAKVALDGSDHLLGHGAVAIAAITSCTNTSNPSVMVAAALLARNAARLGLRSKPWVKTTLSPGSRVVMDYLDAAGLTPFLEELGFHLTGFGCMTCIGASGPLIPEVEEAVRRQGLSVVSVLSGNRNFAGRINADVRMNYLASPPLVVLYALTGTMNIDLLASPVGFTPAGAAVYLDELWPSPTEIADVVENVITPKMFTEAYGDLFDGDSRWSSINPPAGETFEWDPNSTYLRQPPYFDHMQAEPETVRDICGARVLAKLGNSVTTDHISPAGTIPVASTAGMYLTEKGIDRFHFNTYASRRGNHEVMMRGALTNVQLRNDLVPGVEGGYTANYAASGEVASMFEAASAYREAGTPLVVLAGTQYGTGSSRDWAAKGLALLGVRAVIAESFERIHRANLIGMGILPLQYRMGENAASLGITGAEVIDILGLDQVAPGDNLTVQADGIKFTVVVRLDTLRERETFAGGGILQLVLRTLQTNAAQPAPTDQSSNGGPA